MRELPKGWEICRLEDIAQWGSGGTPSRRNADYYDGTIPWVKTGELGQRFVLDAEEKITESALQNSSAKIFPKGSVAIAMYGATIGKTSIFGIDAATNQACAVGIPNKQITTAEYLWHYLASQKEEFIEAGKGGAQPNISQGVIKEWEIPLPPLNEQKRIADRLDLLLTRIDKAKTHLDRIPPLLKRFRQSVLAAATSGKLTEDWREEKDKIQEHQVKEPYYHIVSAPVEWEAKTLGDVCEFVGGSQPAKSHFQSEHKSGLVRLIQIRDYKSDRFITYVPTNLARRFCTKEDVMVGRYGPPIFQILRGLEGAYNVALMKAVPRVDGLNLEYLYYWLQQDNLLKYVEGGSDRTVGQDGVRKDLLHVYPFFLPDLSEQHEIVRRVEALFAKADRIEAQYQKARQGIDRLTPALLAKAFRGELVPQDPNDEPASVLLERVKATKASQPATKAKRQKKS